MRIYTLYGRNYDSNIYVILGRVPTIVDTGTGLHSTDVIKNIQKILHPLSIQQILITHEHFDHCGGAEYLLKGICGQAKLLAHKEAVSKLASGESSFAQLLGGTMPKLKVERQLIHGDHLILGDETFIVHHTPGHSPGSICLYSTRSKSLISGDTIFADGNFGRYDLPGGDFNALVHSLERMKELDVANLYPGHGSIIEGNGKQHIALAMQNIKSME